MDCYFFLDKLFTYVNQTISNKQGPTQKLHAIAHFSSQLNIFVSFLHVFTLFNFIFTIEQKLALRKFESNIY